MYKLYEYKSSIEIENDDINLIEPTVMQYITDEHDNVLYTKLNDSDWNKNYGTIMLNFEPNLSFKKTLTNKEFESMLFIDAV